MHDLENVATGAGERKTADEFNGRSKSFFFEIRSENAYTLGIERPPWQ
jgi:hypothetical protein